MLHFCTRALFPDQSRSFCGSVLCLENAVLKDLPTFGSSLTLQSFETIPTSSLTKTKYAHLNSSNHTVNCLTWSSQDVECHNFTRITATTDSNYHLTKQLFSVNIMSCCISPMTDPAYPEISLTTTRNHLDHCDQQHDLCFLTHDINTVRVLFCKSEGFNLTLENDLFTARKPQNTGLKTS